MAARVCEPHQCTEAAARITPVLYRGLKGIKRWIGLGVLADNLIHIGEVMAARR